MSLTRINLETLAAIAADREGLPLKQAHRLIEGMLRDITLSLSAGQEIYLHRFGVFKVQETAAREGNGQFGPWSKPAGHKIVFRPAKPFKDLISHS